MKEHKTRRVRAPKRMAKECAIYGSLLKKNGCVLFVLAIFAVFSSPVFSNVALNALQQDADRLPNGGTLILSRPFEIDGTLLIKNKSNVTIDGNNLTITQLKQNTITIKITDCNGVTIKNLVLYGDPASFNPAAETLGIGIYMKGCTGKHLLDNVKFYDNGFTGFYAYNISNIMFNRCLFNASNVAIHDNDNYNCGIYSYEQLNDNWEVKNCTFEKIGMGLILYSNHDHLSIHDNSFTDMRGQHGIYLNASSYVNIYNNIFTNVFGDSIKLQMNEGWGETKTDIKITNNISNVESSHKRGQAGILIGVGHGSPAKGVFWKNVCIENNRVNRSDYGVEVSYVKDANIFNNEFVDTVYGILALRYSGAIRQNTITTTQWSGILCEVMDGLSVVIKDNVIRDTVHITAGDDYKRCGIFLTGSGFVELENNRMYKNEGHPLYGLYQGQNITLVRYNNNQLIGPLELKGPIVSQANNEILR